VCPSWGTEENLLVRGKYKNEEHATSLTKYRPYKKADNSEEKDSLKAMKKGWDNSWGYERTTMWIQQDHLS